ncbi:SpoIVB peptidase [Desulfotruncus alcoholivorax]|uniref:SpoIVB peptidase n=1 Tax=Desulfotruncus alcoholivorax TaxID=265477 RepID=UPI00283A9270|nr:SpoIVB peptidase [Desulfotruncus alcoholivorax]
MGRSRKISSRFRSTTAFILVFVFFMCLMTANSYWHNFLPARQYIKTGDNVVAGMELPKMMRKNISLHIHSSSSLLSIGGNNYQDLIIKPGSSMPVAAKPGKLDLHFKLFGLIPIHHMLVDVVAPVKVIPGGQSIGVLLHSEGVMVVGEAAIDQDGKKVFPARDAGISVGDLILQLNGKEVTSENQLQKLIDKCGRQGKDVNLLVKHGNEVKRLKINPILCNETGRYRVGLFVKDSAAGVGTITFYDPGSHVYGALGHIITDYSGKSIINPRDGKIVEATIKGLHPGKKGEPGEKLGVFKGKSDIIGDISKNTKYGIFGELEKELKNPIYGKPVAVALSYQVKRGPAQILTVLEDNNIQSFNIEIVQVLPGKQSKGMVLQVTDPELIKRTGGIIQGMSGSPILQDGKLVGAVTHVFINDPTRGYGVLAENMLKEANLINIEQLQKKAG